jgi:hypothetical protein
MGYTTTFDGAFAVYRPENPLMAELLRAHHVQGEEAARRALIDWLQEQGDPRGERLAVDPTTFGAAFGLLLGHAAYLRQFSDTRRMKRDPALAATLPDPFREAVNLPIGPDGGYFVGGGGFMGQDRDASILEYNRPPEGQPGLWCQWVPKEDGSALVWNGAEKFYFYEEWLRYLIEHFLAPWGYIVHGQMTWQGEEDEDRGRLIVKENQVDIQPLDDGR